jgi:hypothetical protein
MQYYTEVASTVTVLRDIIYVNLTEVLAWLQELCLSENTPVVYNFGAVPSRQTQKSYEYSQKYYEWHSTHHGT